MKEDGMTKQSRLQCGKQRQILLAQGGQIATNASKDLSAKQGSEASGNLLLNFDHAQIPLGLIVIKRHPQIFQKGPDILLMLAQGFCQNSNHILA